MVVAVMMTVMRVSRGVGRNRGTGKQNHTKQAEQNIAHLHRLKPSTQHSYIYVDKHDSPD